MNLFAILSLVACLTTLILGIRVISGTHRSSLNFLFSVLCFLEAYWCFIEFQMRISESYSQANFWAGLNFLWNFIISIMLHFVFVFSSNRFFSHTKSFVSGRRVILGLVYLPALVFSVIAFFYSEVYGFPKKMPWGVWDLGAPGIPALFYINSGWASLMLLVALYICFRHYISLKNLRQKNRAGLVTTGFIVIILTGIITEGILPALDIRFHRMTSLSFIVAALIIHYAMKRYSLFSLTTDTVSEIIIDKISDAVFLTDKSNRIEACNLAACELSGYVKDDLRGVPLPNLIKDEMRQEFVREVTGKLDYKKKNLKITSYFRTKVQDFIPVEITASIVLEKGTYFSNKIFIIKNVSEKERVYQALEANVAKNELILKMSHDFRNPLTPIIGISDMLLNYESANLNEKQREGLRFIRKNAGQLLELIDAFLDLTKIETGKMTIRRGEVSLKSLIGNLEKKARTLIGVKSVNFSIKIEENVEDVLFTDGKKLEDILANLVDNAVKHIELGSIEVRIYRVEEKLFFRVSDTGKRSIEEVEKVFDSYHKTGRGGLGLPLSKKLSQLLGGDLTLQSHPDTGTIVEFFLPFSALEE